MNYYPFHVGDYAAHTAHLEPMEDLAYRRMLDAYYLREEPLPAEPADVSRLIRMRQNMAEVEAVLREFFTLSSDGWRHSRCDEEIERMQEKQAKARAAATASVSARRAKAHQTLNAGSTTVERPLSERSTDVELPTPTPTPTDKPTHTSGHDAELDDGHSALGPSRDIAGDVLHWHPVKSLLAPRLAIAGVPIPEPPDLARMLQAFRDYYTGKHFTEGQCYQKFVSWIQRDRNHGKPNISAKADRPRGFEYGDSIGDEWLRSERQREAQGGVVSGLD